MFKSYLMGSKLLSIPVVCLLAKQMAPFPELNSPTCYVMGLLVNTRKLEIIKHTSSGYFQFVVCALVLKRYIWQEVFFRIKLGNQFYLCNLFSRKTNYKCHQNIVFFSSLLMFVFDERTYKGTDLLSNWQRMFWS
uniref:Secreted protein n=1 Tax=Cacopsylla melanoneura TaxID=428564 RepID=A0A8D9BSD6_9HEMI